jgi:NhaA family Na+:H+ antiporter
VHATLAGLLMAMTVPARSRIGQRGFIKRIRDQISDFEENRESGQTILKAAGQHRLAANIGKTVQSASTPLQRWHSFFETPIAIIVLPLFALLHAGVHLSGRSIMEAFVSPVTLGIIVGLVVGKPLGIITFSLFALRMRIARIPEGMVFQELIGTALLSGIGFTMSLFITVLGFEHEPELIEPAKIGILLSSILAAIMGIFWFSFICMKAPGISPAIKKSP